MITMNEKDNKSNNNKKKKIFFSFSVCVYE